LRIEREAHFEATPDEIWQLVDDPAEMGAWFAFAERMELVEGTGLGRRQRLHGHWGKRRSEIDQEIVVYEPERALGWRHIAERLDGEPAPRFAVETGFTLTIAPDGDGSRVRLQTRQRPAGWLRGLAMRVFGAREAGEKLDESLVGLRDALGL
jgi:hypothetical protein